MSFPRYESYKESGLSWLGKIPSHWGIMQSRRLFSLRKDKATETDRQLTASQKHGVLYQDDYTAIEGQKVVQVITGAEILKHAEPNDFVISMRSFQGGIEWCGYRGSISSAYVMLIPSDTINVRFFSYLFKCKPYIQALQSTSNLVRDGQALRYDNFTLIHLPVLPYLEQQTIAAFLDRETAKIDALIAEQQRLIELLKEKRQSVISHAVTKGLNSNAPMKDSGIEWLGEVPEHWEVKRLRFIAQLNPSKSEITELDRETEVSFLPMEAIGDDGSLNLERTRPIGEVETGYTYFREGDVTIAKITPCFENGKGAVMRGLFGGIGFGTTELIVARAKPFEATSNYLHWLFISTWFRKHGEASMYGAGGQKRVPDDFVRNYAIGFPSLEEQHTIVAFLDREIAKIDVLTTESKAAITLLKERRTALISAAVTGKIDVRELVSAKAEVKAETVPC